MHLAYVTFLFALLAVSCSANLPSAYAAGLRMGAELASSEDALGWVCKTNSIGECGEVDLSDCPLSVQHMAYKLFGCKQGRCKKFGYNKFVRQDSAQCGPLGCMTANVFVAATASTIGRTQDVSNFVFRNLVSRSLHRVVMGSDKHPGRTSIL